MRAVKGEERALWREAMRDVRPLKNHARRARTETEIRNRDATAEIALTRSPQLFPASGEGIGRAPLESRDLQSLGLDRRTAQKLRRGHLPIAARLDLHGLTQDEAHRALNRFIAVSAAAGQRAVLVITGKSGVLRRMVPLWLAEGENRAKLLALGQAHVQHGGGGALYVLLRRAR